MPVPVIGMVAKCTMKTANPIGNGAKTYTTKAGLVKFMPLCKYKTKMYMHLYL